MYVFYKYILLYFIALLSIVKAMKEDWVEFKADAEREVMIKQARTARRIMICGYILMVFAFSVLIILPSFGLHFRHLTNLTDGNRLLPLQAYYFYDTDKSPQFELTLIVQAITMFLGAITYTSIDSFLGLAIFHISGQLENFRRRLVNLVLCEDFDNALRNNVETHLRLIRFCESLLTIKQYIVLQ